MMNRKYGDLGYRYRYQGSRKYLQISYRFRIDPVPGISKFRKWHGTRCTNNGHGKGHPWKKAFVGARIHQRELREELGITFTMPDKIPYKYGYRRERGWKRTKKCKQWM